MKKTLAAIAVLGAFAGSAMAADVTLYGIVDEGLLYTHIDADQPNVDATDNLQLKSGIQSGSRWGLKGKEDLGNGYSVGFILESGFNADDGTMAVSGTLFNREASLSVYGPFGQLSAGHFGSLNQGTSSWGKLGMISAFGTSFSDYSVQAGSVFAKSKVWDNMIAYQSPAFAGFKVYAQYAMGDNAEENKPTTDRYYLLGATYQNGPFAALLTVDSVNYDSSYATTQGANTDDSLSVTLGGSYDFQVVKAFVGAQYFDEVALANVGTLSKIGAPKFVSGTKLTGYGLELSASAPVLGGTGMFGVSYLDAEQSDCTEEQGTKFDATRWAVSAGYTYPLSKRTNLYGVVSYMKDSFENKTVGNTDDKVEPSAVAAMFGMRHTF